ncbi:Valine--tRNA ligase, mitochondrial [Collichthys lucidus]|uniref:valine--tRNA ligase n=1 Tax=Collichthys lucidus TaxID=240159 RepID=A0A4U5VKH8_COLLU|nr:Valine--tRNA ligase, mitochondrial [Collichthys lucidus]
MLGWPEQTADLQCFYPNSILETGSDLIFFWVARMVMLGTELTGQLPFRQVLLHSLRLQEKVKEGNLDPREQLVAMEAQRRDFPKGIPQCGTDALRFALCSHRTQGEDISLSVSHVLSCRNFCNKMWQTLRFTLGVLGDNTTPVTTLEETAPLSSMDQWICSRLHSTVAQCEEAFEAYELHTVTSALYSFWVHSLCDVYMEYMKPVLLQQDDRSRQVASSVLYHCVSASLALLSPFMPFITEELWQRLQPFRPGPAAQTSSLCLQPYPSSSQLAHWNFPETERDFLLVQEVIRVARSLRAQCGMTKEKPAMWAVCSPSQAQVLRQFGSAVWTLSRISNLHIYCPHGADDLLSTHSTPPPPEGSLLGVVDHTCQLHLHVQSGINIDKQILQLSRRRDKLVPKLEKILCRVRSPDYLTKAPAHVREQIDSKMSALQQELKTVEDQLRVLQETQN